MRKNTTMAVCVFFLVLTSAPALAQTYKFDCPDPKTSEVWLTIEVDMKKQTVRHWNTMFGTARGPFGPHEAKITQEQIVWKTIIAKGREGSMSGSLTTWTLSRKTLSLRIRDEANYIQGTGDWTYESPPRSCKAG
jgi:hypothetical protein